MTEPLEYAPPPTERFRSPYKPRRGMVLGILLLLTLIAGVLRFVALDRPPIWGDESATAGRVVGTYQELVNQLAEGSFTPLHYEVLWWLAQGIPYNGDLVERPAQPDRRITEGYTFSPTSRIVENGIVLTPFYLRFFPALFGTLMVPAIYFLARQMFGARVSLLAATLACFSAYLLIYSRDAKMYMPFWLFVTLYIACLLWWLRTRTWTSWLCWVGAGATMLGYHALGYFVLVVSGLIWISYPKQYWAGLWKLPAILAWPIVVGVAGIYELIRKRYDLMVWWRFREVVRYPLAMWPRFYFPTILLFVAGLYVITLGTRSYFDAFSNRVDQVLRDDGTFSVDANGTGWVQPYNSGREIGRLTLYTTSAYLTGWEWPRTKEIEHVDEASQVNPRTLKLLQASVLTLLALLALGLVPWRRIFCPARARHDRLTQDLSVDRTGVARRTLWIGLWLFVPAFIMYSQSAKSLATVFDGFSAIALKTPAEINWPRLPKLPTETDQSLYAFYTSPDNITPFKQAFGKSWAQFKSQFTAESVEWNKPVLIGLSVLATLLLIAIIWRRRTLTRNALRVLTASIVVILLVGLISFSPRFTDKSVWMPRYVGVVVPAFLIMSAALIVRLPTWWLRWGAIAVFVVVNLAQFTARVFTPSEPPIDRIATDILASDAQDATTRTYVRTSHGGPEPGRSLFPSSPASYYLWLGKPDPKAPASSIRHGHYHQDRVRVWQGDDPSAIARSAERSQQITRIIVWTTFDAKKVDTTDPIGDAMKGRFKRISDEVMPAFDHWTWRHIYNLRRREYVRIAA
jgi:4-amino-4-deoxy-L-arabinose transferase-like glycosyltransferase